MHNLTHNTTANDPTPPGLSTEPAQFNKRRAFDISAFLNRINRRRVPIRTKLTLFITILIISIMSIAGIYFFSVQKQEFVAQTIRFGSALVSNLSRNCSVPLLENDEASLNLFIEDLSKTRDFAYVMIIDKKGMIRAHSNIASINRLYRPISRPIQITSNGLLEIIRFHDGNHELLDISSPVSFNAVMLGSVHLGISLETLQKKIFQSGLFALGLTVVLVGVGIAVSFSISTQFSRPVQNLLAGTEAIADGNFSFQVEHQRNDELGDLSLAFNDMADKLFKKELMREAFNKYVNPEVVDMILQHPDEKWFQGKKIRATVLFTDIRGFTSFSEAHPPEEVVEILNQHFSVVTEIILEHGGLIDKFIGDSVMAVFGVPTACDDHVDRAVCAAVAIRNRLSGNGTETEHLLRIGIGINTGEVIAGNIGSNRRMEYTVIGDTVNLASRLTDIAQPGEIIISESTCHAAAAPLAAVKLDPVKVKGKQEPAEIYRLEGFL